MTMPNRIGLGLVGLALFGVNLAGFLVGKPGPKAPPQFIYLPMAGFGALLVGVAIFGYRRKMPTGLEDFEAKPDAPGSIVSDETGITGRGRRVVIDPARGTVRFEWCHVPWGFLARAEPSLDCELADVVAVSEIHQKAGSHLVIVTPRGKAQVSSRASGFDGLLAYLLSLGLPALGGPEVENPQLPGLAMFGALAGILLGWWSSSLGEADATFAGRLVAGASLGALFPFALVYYGDRLFGLRLVYPLVGALGGTMMVGLLSLLVVSLFPRGKLDDLFGKADWNTLCGAAGGLMGGLGGLVVGFRINRAKSAGRRRAKPAPPPDLDLS